MNEEFFKKYGVKSLSFISSPTSPNIDEFTITFTDNSTYVEHINLSTITALNKLEEHIKDIIIEKCNNYRREKLQKIIYNING